MSRSNSGSHHGMPNGHSSAPRPPPGRRLRSQPYTLTEALPFSPQTSVIPFTPDLIPQPALGSASVSSSITSLFDTHEFENLNKEAKGQTVTPKALQLAADYTIQGLKTTKRTKYKFPAIHGSVQGKKAAQDLTSGLSPLTRLVYDKLPNLFDSQESRAQLTPKSGQVKASPTIKTKSPASKKTQTPRVVQDKAINSQAYAQNTSRIEIVLPSAAAVETVIQPPITTIEPAMLMQMDTTFDDSVLASHPTDNIEVLPPVPLQAPQDTPVTPVKTTAQQNDAAPRGFVIEIPTSIVNRDEYAEAAVPDSPDEPLMLSSRKRKLESGEAGSLFTQSVDQRQRSETALKNLNQLIWNILDAADQGPADGQSSNPWVTWNNSQEAALTAEAHQKVQTNVRDVIERGCYSQIPVEDLLRLQKLSEPALKQMETLDIKVEESWGESEVQNWIQQLRDVELAMKAARTSLRIMSGGREDKQLYSEETVQQCLDAFRAVIDGIIIRVSELRPSGPGGSLFKLLLPHKKVIGSVFTSTQKLFTLLATLITTIELSERVVNVLEFTASRLIFVENAYFDKESVVGGQKFDGIRMVAMEMLSQIFLANESQRQGIINDILTSLEKLPVGRQSARTFKLAEGGSIQPVSALIMRLVHSSSSRLERKGPQNAELATSVEGDVNGEDEGHSPSAQTAAVPGPVFSAIKTEEVAATEHETAINELGDMTSSLKSSVTRHANHVINFIVKRAQNSTKTGDTPYRNLLDLFVEDFTTCLELPDWPAAEVLLQLLLRRMAHIFEDKASQTPAKNMALEVLGTMCAAISKLRSQVRKMANAIENSEDADSELARFISYLAHSALELQVNTDQVISWSGPFRITLEYLESRCSKDPHLKSSVSFLVLEWANRLRSAYASRSEDEAQEAQDEEYGRLAYRLRMMTQDQRWLSSEYDFKKVTDSQARLCYSIILLRSQFCAYFNNILHILLQAMASDQATVRSKSLRSINQVLEIDPSILDSDQVVSQIQDCSMDSSTQVRDSALGLIGKCIVLRPRLEDTLTPTILDKLKDAGVGVRKRALKLARDIYLRNQSKALRSNIASSVLARVQDPDEGVRDVARQMLEEVWFAPFYNSDDSAASQTALTDHVALMVQTVKAGTAKEIMDKVLQSILSSQNKSGTSGPFEVCAKWVANMFNLIDNLDSVDPAIPAGRDALQILTIFAKADAKLFTFEQIRLLKPHLSSFEDPEDRAVFWAVVGIYRRVLPQLSASLHADFLIEVRDLLQKSIGKLRTRILDDVIACFWIIAQLLNITTPVKGMARSCIMSIQKLQRASMNTTNTAFLDRYSTLLGMIGKHCDLEPDLDFFKQNFPDIFQRYEGKNGAKITVTKLMVDALIPFTSPRQPQDARKCGLYAIGLICQSWPRNYVSANVYTAFQQVFTEQVPVLEEQILGSFKEFLLTEERRSEAAGVAAKTGSSDGEKNRELTVMGGTNYDDVASATTQRFLGEITRVSLSGEGNHALLALEVLGTINRQGLVHPKETCITFMTLETSRNPLISELAFKEHRALHEKHETVLEREYVKAVQSAFAYQRDVVQDVHGANTTTWQSKFHSLMDVLKISKSKNRQKFLEKLVSQIDFDPAKIKADDEKPPHYEYSRFLGENIAFFDYMTVGELHMTVNAVEKLVTSTGAGIAQTIESEILNIRMDMISDKIKMEPDQPAPPARPLDVRKLRQLTACSMILLSVWEVRTFLRRLYGMGVNRRETKAKAQTKDLTKTPIRLPGVSFEKFWEDLQQHASGLQSHEKMMEKCKAFVELMNVDKEVKIADDEDDLNDENPATPSEGGEDDQDAPGSGRGRKRKATNTPGGRKKRQRSTSRPRGRGRPRKQSVDADADGDLEEDWF